MRASDYKLAEAAAEKLASDPDVKAFMKHAYLSSSLFGTWEHPVTGQSLPDGSPD